MKSFCKMTKLSNIGGRADYISNPARQEQILAKSEPVDWKPYQEYERAHQMSSEPNNEGREMIIALPNAWAELTAQELAARAQCLAVAAVAKATDLQWAVHWNKDHTNLHMHVVFSERQKENNPGCWDRNIYLTDDGKVARRKADRARLPDGSVAPPIHRKGELKDGFTAKNTDYKSRRWLHEQKGKIRAELKRLGAVIDRDQLLHEYHEGKGAEAPAIRAKNIVIRANNDQIEQILAKYPSASLKQLKFAAMKAVNESAVLYTIPDGTDLYPFRVPMAKHKQIQEIKTLIQDLDTGSAQYASIQQDLNACSVLQVKKKKKLSRELDACADHNKELVKKAESLGVSVSNLVRLEDLKPSLNHLINDLILPPREKTPEPKKPSVHFKLEQVKAEIAQAKADRQPHERSRSTHTRSNEGPVL